MKEHIASKNKALDSSGRIPVAPQDIESALVKIWRDAASRDVASELKEGQESLEVSPRVRAVLSNIVIVSPYASSGARHDLNLLINGLSVSHPSRFFLIEVIEDEAVNREGVDSGVLKTFVSSRCVLAHSGTHVCSEEVYIVTTPAGVSRVPNLLLSLLVPDVSAILFVNLDPCCCKKINGFESEQMCSSRRLISSITPMCDRVLYDSMLFSQYQTDIDSFVSDLKSSKEAFAQGEQGVVGESGCVTSNEICVRDINWRRGRRFRELIARQFDKALVQEAVGEISSVVLNCLNWSGKTSKLPAEIILTSAWIASRLEWLPLSIDVLEEKKGVSITCRAPNEQTSCLEFRISKCSYGESSKVKLEGVSFMFDGAQVRGMVSVNRMNFEEIVEISDKLGGCSINGDGSVRCRMPFAEQGVEELILADIRSSSFDSNFDRTLEKMLQISQVLVST